MRWIAVAMALAAAPAWGAESPSDIVWPSYDQAARASDAGLSCPALADEVAHVTSDVSTLRRARNRVEDALRSAFDLERYAGRTGAGGMRVNAGAADGKEAYANARTQIVASLRVAEARRDHLKSLEPGCKSGPQPASAP